MMPTKNICDAVFFVCLSVSSPFQRKKTFSILTHDYVEWYLPFMVNQIENEQHPLLNRLYVLRMLLFLASVSFVPMNYDAFAKSSSLLSLSLDLL